MTFKDALLEQEAKRLFPELFAYIPACDCTEDIEPEECDKGHLVCGSCGEHMVEARL